jgi:hypothetical protein
MRNRHLDMLAAAQGTTVVSLDRRWYGDGPPQWVEAAGKRWERPCRTASDASELREQSVSLLRRHGKGHRTALALADRLDECAPRQRCMSGACPECCRAHQRWFVAHAGQLIQDASSDDQTFMVSIVPEFAQFLPRELGEVDIDLVTRKTLRLLKSAGVTVAVGATDFSINIDFRGCTPYLQLQYTFFTSSKDGLSNRRLRRALSPTGNIKRPVRVTEFDGENAGLAYALKYEFVVRETYFQDTGSRVDGRSCRNTRNRPLRGQKWVAMMLLLDTIGLHGRLALIGAKRIKQAGTISLRLI